MSKPALLKAESNHSLTHDGCGGKAFLHCRQKEEKSQLQGEKQFRRQRRFIIRGSVLRDIC